MAQFAMPATDLTVAMTNVSREGAVTGENGAGLVLEARIPRR